jgi:hypothetical protein
MAIPSRLSPGLSSALRNSHSRLPSPFTKHMSSKATVYVLPIDPRAPSATVSAPVDPVKLWASALTGNKPAKVGTSRVFYGENGTTALTSLGDKFEKKTGDARRELVRKAVGSAVKAAKGLGDQELNILVDASLDPHASGAFDCLCCNLRIPKRGHAISCRRAPRALQLYPQDRPAVYIPSWCQGRTGRKNNHRTF